MEDPNTIPTPAPKDVDAASGAGSGVGGSGTTLEMREAQITSGAEDVTVTSEERALAERLGVSAKAFVVMRDAVVKEAMRRGGGMSKGSAVASLAVDAHKTGAVYDFLVRARWIAPREDAIPSASAGEPGSGSLGSGGRRRAS